jgi:hypothetical protein
MSKDEVEEGDGTERKESTLGATFLCLSIARKVVDTADRRRKGSGGEGDSGR